MTNCGYEKGEIVCLLILEGGNAYRNVRNKPRECRFKSGIVKSVGRKYITVNDGIYDQKFDVEGSHVQYADSGSVDYKLFHTQEAADEYLLVKELLTKIKTHFNPPHYGNLTLDQLKRISAILDEEETV